MANSRIQNRGQRAKAYVRATQTWPQRKVVLDMTKPIPNLYDTICSAFDDKALPSLRKFVEIRNLSPAFDPKGEAVSQTHAALEHISTWVQGHTPKGTKINKLTRSENAPMLIIDIPGTTDGAIMCFGHLDKYPEAEGWDDGLSAYSSTQRNDRLFGRGIADGGFAAYAYITAIIALAERGVPFPRIVIALETSYQSHGIHLARYFEDLRTLCNSPDLIISLDAICADYDRLWYSTGYRGIIEGNLTVEILDKPSHSGASGLVPSALGIAFELVGRVCDLSSGMITMDSFKAKKPPKYVTSGGAETDAIAGRYFLEVHGLKGPIPGITDNPEAAAMLPVWNSTLSIANIQGFSSSDWTGGILPPKITLKIGVRTPPGFDCFSAVDALEKALIETPPYNATVDFSPTNVLPGWYPNNIPKWLEDSVTSASSDFLGKKAVGWCIGGAYPEIEIIAQEFGDVPIFMTGIMGPDANFHIANESLFLPAARKMTATIAQILADFPAN